MCPITASANAEQGSSRAPSMSRAKSYVTVRAAIAPAIARALNAPIAKDEGQEALQARLHGFLAYLARCAVAGRPYTILGYKGKQVRDNIHSADLVDAFLHFYRAPRCGDGIQDPTETNGVASVQVVLYNTNDVALATNTTDAAGAYSFAGLAPGALQAAVFDVTKTADTNDGTCDADCSLREAIVAANGLAGSDTVNVPAGTYLLSIAGTGEDAAAAGDLDITGTPTISAAGPDGRCSTRIPTRPESWIRPRISTTSSKKRPAPCRSTLKPNRAPLTMSPTPQTQSWLANTSRPRWPGACWPFSARARGW